MRGMTGFLLLLALCVGPAAAEPKKQLSAEQAELLARTAAEPSGITKLKGFSLERAEPKQFPAFYFFDAIVSEPGAEGFSGHYAVNKFTGDVWDPYKCVRISDPHLLELQQKMRKELRLTKRDHQRQQKSEPCLADSQP